MRKVPQRRHSSLDFCTSGEGWLAKTPDGLGAAPGNLNARQISSPRTYSPSDQVVSDGVISEERILGGATKSLASTLSPRWTCHGNSPSTSAVTACAVVKWVNMVPACCKRCLPPRLNPCM